MQKFTETLISSQILTLHASARIETRWIGYKIRRCPNSDAPVSLVAFIGPGYFRLEATLLILSTNGMKVLHTHYHGAVKQLATASSMTSSLGAGRGVFKDLLAS